MSRRGALAAGLAGLSAVVLFLGARFAYGDFMPLRGYTPVDAQIISVQEGLFFALYTVLGGLAAAGLGLAAWGLLSAPVADRLEALADRLSLRLCYGVAFLLAATGSVLVTTLVVPGAFLTDDEMAMLFQARLLAEGRLSADPVPFPSVFSYAMIVETPHWYGMYPVGHPALMALSLRLTGGTHAVVALAAGLSAVLTLALARRLFDKRTALLSTALLLASPFFVLSSGTLASEVTSGAFLLAAMNAAVRLDSRRGLLAAAGLGASLGAAALIRPFTAMAVALPLGALLAAEWLGGRVKALAPVVVLLTGLPFVVAYAASNAAVTGSPWLSPYEMNFPGQFWLGFGQDAFGVFYTPGLALGAAGMIVVSLNAWALGWPASLLPAALGLGLGRPRGKALAIALVPLVVLVAHLPVPIGGVHDTGPLYYLEVLPPLVVFGARGLILAGRRVEGLVPGRGRDLVAWLSLSSVAVGAGLFWTQQVAVLRSLAAFERAPYELADRLVEGRGVVFVPDVQTSPPSSWVLGHRPPAPDLSDRVLYGKVPPPSLAADIIEQSDRRPYYMSRDRRTGDVTLLPLAPPRPRRAPAGGEPGG